MAYVNGSIQSSNDDPTNIAMIPHSYVSSNSNPSYSTVAVVAAPSLSPAIPLVPYQQYHVHHLAGQSQTMLPMPSGTAPFYPGPNISHLVNHGDFSNSSSSATSSSSSLESSKRTGNRKRAGDKNSTPTNKMTAKRKSTHHDDDDIDEDDDDDDDENKYNAGRRSMTNQMLTNSSNIGAGDEDKEKQARENHCEIERRRRVKMASYFAELCDMVPACSNLARKPDKLTILRMAGQYMKNLRPNNASLTLNSQNFSSSSTSHDLHKPSFLNDQELKFLMVESCDAFLFALNCEDLRIIYVSDAIQSILSYTCQDWYARLFYDLLHPGDVEKVREQLSLHAQDASTNGNGCAMNRVLDLKTGTVKKDAHSSGSRLSSSKRSFICRLRVGSNNMMDHHHHHGNSFINPSVLRRRHRTSLGPSIDGQLYEVVHISGYIRNLSNHHHSSTHVENNSIHPVSSSNTNGQLAFIGIARIQNSCSPNVNDLTNGPLSTVNSLTNEFTCRCQWESGEILFVDQRCKPITGLNSQDLLHKIIFEQIHPEDQTKFDELFKKTVVQRNSINSSSNLSQMVVRFRTNHENDFISLKTSIYAFCNPCTNEIEFLIVTFISMEPHKKVSVISTNEYNRSSYESYPRSNNEGPHYSNEPSANYVNVDDQNYSNPNAAHDVRVFSSNNGPNGWASTNDSWSTTRTIDNGSIGTNNVEYVDEQTNLPIYHQYQ